MFFNIENLVSRKEKCTFTKKEKMTKEEMLERFGEQPEEYPSIEYDMYEGRIKRAVRESIDKLLRENNLLLEYYGTRDKFKKEIKNRFEQIFQNYCLITYGTPYKMEELRHWYREYDTQMDYLYNYQITNNDSSKARYKALSEAIDEWMTKFDGFVKRFKEKKLPKEKIDPDCEEIDKAIRNFVDNLDVIKEYLARYDRIQYEEFV